MGYRSLFLIAVLIVSAACSKDEAETPTESLKLDLVSNLRVKPPTQIIAGECSAAFKIDFLNVSGAAVQPMHKVDVVFSATGNAKFYSDPGCVEQLQALRLASGASSASFYFKAEAAGSSRLRITALLDTPAVQEFTLAIQNAGLPPVNPDPPVVNPDPPVVNPDPPVVNPDPPVVNPDPPVVNPDPPVVNPDPPVVNPDPPVVNPDPPVGNPDPPVGNPDPPVGNPDPPVVNPDPPVGNPDPPVGNPDPQSPPTTSNTSAGTLDFNFNGTGKVTTRLGVKQNTIYSIGVDAQQKIVVAGTAMNSVEYNDFGLARYNLDGSLDSTFGNSGKVITSFGSGNDNAYSVAIQPDEKILVGGYATVGDNIRFALARYTSQGKLDTSFAKTGKVTTQIGSWVDVLNKIALQSNGKILGVGYRRVKGTNGGAAVTDSAIVRYKSDGTLDTSFNTRGFAVASTGGGNDSFYGVAQQSDGKIVAAGDSACCVQMVRFTDTGARDSTFGTAGILRTDVVPNVDEDIRDMAIQSDGKIVLAGYTNGANKDFLVLRYSANGILDSAFGQGGKVITPVGPGNDFAYAVAIQQDGKIVVSGQSLIQNKFVAAVLRYNADGTLDSTFGAGGTQLLPRSTGGDYSRALALQQNGNILLGGATIAAKGEFLLFRLFH